MKTVRFVCIENSARSVMAETLFNALRKKGWNAVSAGLKPTGGVKPFAAIVLQEKGFDVSNYKPVLLTPCMTEDADRIITLGCMDACPTLPLEKTEDWKLENPVGKPLEAFRAVRDEFERRVKAFAESLD